MFYLFLKGKRKEEWAISIVNKSYLFIALFMIMLLFVVKGLMSNQSKTSSLPGK